MSDVPEWVKPSKDAVCSKCRKPWHVGDCKPIQDLPSKDVYPSSAWPKLSETLKFERHPTKCQSCDAICWMGKNGFVWMEHDEKDQPTPIHIVLCNKCEKIIEPHVRLYTRMDKWAPIPGAMPTCSDCRFRDDLKCNSPDLKANGGNGLILNFPPPLKAFVDGTRGGKRTGWMQLIYSAPVSCKGKSS